MGDRIWTGIGRGVGEFLACFDQRVRPNVTYLVPHGTVRYGVMGLADRLRTEEELARIGELIAMGRMRER